MLSGCNERRLFKHTAVNRLYIKMNICITSAYGAKWVRGFNLLIEGLMYRPELSLLNVGITVLENLSPQFLLTSLSKFLHFSLDVTVSNLNIYINLLKPTGHVMHHQFNIQQLYALTTLYLCVLYLSENKQRLVPLTA
jgi:hypothetical protein